MGKHRNTQAGVYMAWGKTKESSDGAPIKRYIGVAPVSIVCINPTAKELSKIYGRDIDEEPVYIGEVTNDDGTTTRRLRIDFFLKTDPDKCGGIDMITKLSIFLNDSPWVSQAGKVQVIDKYGRTAWVTKEQYKNHDIPEYSNGPARISKDYKVAYRGQADLVDFLRIFLNVRNPDKYDSTAKKWMSLPDNELPDCESELEHIKDYFSGDIREIREAVALQPSNKIKVLFGVRKSGDRLYQDVYTRMFMPASQTNYDRLKADVTAAQTNGAYPDSVFIVDDIREYDPVPTDLSKPQGDAAKQHSDIDDFFNDTHAAFAPQAGNDDDLPF